jgi:ATP-dependent Clp protease ATP-binding subunit ClpA
MYEDCLNEMALQAMQIAMREAKRLGSPTVKPEHVLAGVLRVVNDQDCAARVILKDYGVSAATIGNALHLAKPNLKLKDDPTADPELDEVIELAKREADFREHPCIGTDHLLLAMMSYNKGPTAEAFRAVGLQPNHAKK